MTCDDPLDGDGSVLLLIRREYYDAVVYRHFLALRLAPSAIYYFVPNGKNNSKFLVCLFENQKITCHAQ